MLQALYELLSALYYLAMDESENKFLPTGKVKELLKISDCDVMHLRVSDEIRFEKRGNAYWYLRTDVEKLIPDEK